MVLIICLFAVLSSDYRFGDGDLGPRGMALFFKTFRHNTLADAMGIPVFPLSKNELKHQARYEDDESLDDSSYASAVKGLDRFAAMDVNRSRRQSVLMTPPQEIIAEDMQKTERRSNQSKVRDDIRKSLRASFRGQAKPVFSRSTSDVDEVKICLELAKEDFKFDNKAFRRKASGEMMHNTKKRNTRASLMVRQISEPMPISSQTRANLGRVHYQLAVLHGMGRFPEVVPVGPDDDKDSVPPHDAFSVLYHLSHAASMKCVPACLALGRLHAGLGTSVSNLLSTIVPIDFVRAKELLRRAMESPFPPAAPKAAAGCFLYQVYLDERESDDLEEEKASDATIMQLIEDILKLIDESAAEKKELESHKTQLSTRDESRFHPGDRAEGNYFLEGTYYSGVIEAVSEDGNDIAIKYDDDGSTETLTPEHVRLLVPPAATQTVLGGPLSDEEALGAENSDERFLVEIYELKAELGELKAVAGDKEAAAALIEDASNDAMLANKMKKATELSLRASELLE
jgi:elongation factor 2 kinase